MDIRSDHQKGLSYAEIARKYHIDVNASDKMKENAEEKM